DTSGSVSGNDQGFDDENRGPERKPELPDADADIGTADEADPDLLNEIGRGTSADPQGQLP
ncbi:MAG: hypothetical protein M3116_01070, partial [Actinomycetota bacterium]|nr:hypothetical protein [Actinomycetota bacterium]